MANGLRLGIVLSGTAPAMTLMSGAMLAFARHNVTFDVISTTGVGGLIGMLYLAPKHGKTPEEALRELPNLFVSDWLYRLVPVNFKVFHKYGPFAERFYQLRKSLPKFPLAPEDPNPLKRFMNDWMELWATALTPRSYQSATKGLMSHVPLVDDLVDFAKLKAMKPRTRFYVNAFSLYSKRLQFFDNDTVTPDIYNAAQSMFMLFPPVRVKNDLLTTGASRDPTGLQAIWLHERDKLSAVLALDPLARCFWREPTNAYDAFQLMLMNPIVALQQLMYCLYSRTDQIVNPWAGNPAPPPGAPKLPRLFGMPVDIPKDHWPTMLKWTHANALALQEAGYQAALPVADLLASRGERAFVDADVDRRFGFWSRFLEPQPRSQQFLQTFTPLFKNYAEFIARDGENKGVQQEGKASGDRTPPGDGQSGREVTS